jgi:hypothetical protein
MLSSEITEVCQQNYVLKKHFKAVVDADGAGLIKKDKNSRNCFWIANTGEASFYARVF